MTIFRLFATAEDATGAATDLTESGFDPSIARVVTKGAAGSGAMALHRLGAAAKQANHYAERIEEGAALLVLDPPFGTAAQALKVLARHGGGEGDTAAAVHEGSTWDSATPLSSAFGIPVLCRRDPTPLSSFWKLPTLLRDKGSKRSLFGLPLLSPNPAPLSDRVGFKPLLTQAAPLSALAGLKVLSNDPTPLSSLLQVKVLSKQQTTLY